MNTELLAAEVLNEQAYFHYPLETFTHKLSTMIINLVPKIPYHFGYQIEDLFQSKLNEHSYDRLFFFTEKGLYDMLDTNFISTLQKGTKPCEVIYLDGGEKNKSFDSLSSICNTLIKMGVTKDSILLAFGGGAVGNIVGLAAALIFRGIRFIEIPTNFLSQTDSTLSHKQAVNGAYGKNQFGVYHAPLFIWADCSYLKTEPKRTIQSGLVESIKNGFISDQDFLFEIEKYVSPDNYASIETLCQLVFNSVNSKNKILAMDPSEKKKCIVLEYGHTFGHALEWMSKGKMFHGEAVALGMLIAAEVAVKQSLINREIADYHHHVICDRLQIEPLLPCPMTVDDWFHAMVSDNKKTSKGVQYVLLDRIGNCYSENDHFQVSVENGVVRDILEDCINKWAA